MRRPILYVIAVITLGSLVTAGISFTINYATGDARGNKLPYKNVTVEFPDMGNEQFVDPSPPPRFANERPPEARPKSSP